MRLTGCLYSSKPLWFFNISVFSFKPSMSPDMFSLNDSIYWFSNEPIDMHKSNHSQSSLTQNKLGMSVDNEDAFLVGCAVS